LKNEYIGKLVKGNDTVGNGLVTGVQKVDNPEYITHVITVTYPKTGHKDINYILSESQLKVCGSQTIEFIE